MCGVFGIHGHDEAGNIAYLGMHAIQHRGQESAGLVAADDGRLRRHVAMSLVSDAFNRDVLKTLPGQTAIGHVRYSTAGSSELRNAQPFLFEYAGGSIAIAHNGNLVNATELRAELERHRSHRPPDGEGARARRPRQALGGAPAHSRRLLSRPARDRWSEHED